MKNKIAVIAAHPDEEILGCGATMAKHIQAKDEVSVLIMAEGITSRDQQRDRDARSNELS
jgi:LmbE family N-acetylglucosaminyl deacetylase